MGFSRTRSAYEAAREALLFGVEPPVKSRDFERDTSPLERVPARGRTRLEARKQDREQNRKAMDGSERARFREASVWDALDAIGYS